MNQTTTCFEHQRKRVESDGLFEILHVYSTAIHLTGAVIVRVPWCRFAREVTHNEHYAALLAMLEQESSDVEPADGITDGSDNATCPVGETLESGEQQWSLF